MYLLNTNVVSELRRRTAGKADPTVVAWASQVNIEDARISAVTVMELERGVLLIERRDPSQGRLLRRWLEDSIYLDFVDRTIPYDAAEAKACARLHVPRTRPERDAMIAATALVHSCTVATRNEKDFEDTGVAIVNPWTWEG